MKMLTARKTINRLCDFTARRFNLLDEQRPNHHRKNNERPAFAKSTRYMTVGKLAIVRAVIGEGPPKAPP
jgi:hypothetical protein